MTKTIAVIGLGYVGLPLAVAFGAQRPVIGFDINRARIDALRAGHDATREIEAAELASAREILQLRKSHIHIMEPEIRQEISKMPIGRALPFGRYHRIQQINQIVLHSCLGLLGPEFGSMG